MSVRWIISQLAENLISFIDEIIDEIINKITEEFDIDAISAGRDLYEYLDFLKREKMLD